MDYTNTYNKCMENDSKMTHLRVINDTNNFQECNDEKITSDDLF